MIYFKQCLAVFFWGLTFLFTKTALQEAGIPTLVLARSFLGLLTVALFLREFKWLKNISKTDWLKLTFLSLTGILIQQNAQGYAILHTSTNHAGWLATLSPVVVAFIMVAFLGEKIARDKMMGFAVCILGVLLVFTSTQVLADGSSMHTGKGDLIFIATSINWAIYVIPLSIWFKNMPNLRVTFCIFLIATLIMLPVEILTGAYKNFAGLSPRAVWSLVYLGIFCSGFAFIFYNEGLEKIGTLKTSAFLYAQPFVTTFAGYLVFGEQISRETIIGGIMIMCGLYMINVRRRHIRKFYITLIRYFRV
ncbi:MAG: DMT family transporter [Elusimicrobium sp.]|jgi:drug/metabolite transporter (DMT)-like permease|nr:DMT family transporter [Elusimicrobium sp.]